MPLAYTPTDWYWHIASPDEVYSSKRDLLITTPGTDTDYQNWLAFGGVPTELPNEWEMWEVMNDYCKTAYKGEFRTITIPSSTPVVIDSPPPSVLLLSFSGHASTIDLPRMRGVTAVPRGLVFEVWNTATGAGETVTIRGIGGSPTIVLLQPKWVWRGILVANTTSSGSVGGSAYLNVLL